MPHLRDSRPHVEALESAGLVHVVLPPNTKTFGGLGPATNLTTEEARAFALKLLMAALELENV
jgi:hypothetical protein